ncbi:integumentary mucin C.1-like, partial [Cynara cardunculus var. scolymus]|uniref:integumentary mucin C.1-like n=1 Tax=Cynara cardunculus var. scolymus TaxID=59895 RepID=UPI000D62DE7F
MAAAAASPMAAAAASPMAAAAASPMAAAAASPMAAAAASPMAAAAASPIEREEKNPSVGGGLELTRLEPAIWRSEDGPPFAGASTSLLNSSNSNIKATCVRLLFPQLRQGSSSSKGARLTRVFCFFSDQQQDCVFCFVSDHSTAVARAACVFLRALITSSSSSRLLPASSVAPQATRSSSSSCCAPRAAPAQLLYPCTTRSCCPYLFVTISVPSAVPTPPAVPSLTESAVV